MDDFAAKRPGQPTRGKLVAFPGIDLERGALALTEQELTVLKLLADGMRPSEIAWTLETSVRSLHSTRRRLYAKLDARSDEHAVAIAFRRGLLTIDRRGS